MIGSMVFPEVPKSEELGLALEQQSIRDIQRISLVARFDIVAYNPRAESLQVWCRKDGRNQVILNHEIKLRDKQHFFDLVQLIGKVAQLFAVCEEYRIPNPWWAYRFV
jgi:hypothetical protein